MQQFFSWRFWAAIGAVVLLAVGLSAFVRNDDPIVAIADPTPTPHRVDLLSIVYAAESKSFRFDQEGRSRGSLDLILDAQRTMHIMAGTLGEVECDELGQIGRCAVVADLLGDGVVWFAVVPVARRLTLELPPIESLDGGYATLANGWQIRHVDVVERRCDTESASLLEFIRDFGPQSTTIVSLDSQRIEAVVC